MKNWNSFIKAHESKVYQLYEWGNVLSEVHGHELVYLEEERGVFPLAYVKSRIFGNRLISLPFADYGGPCADDEKTAKMLIAKAEEKAGELGADFMEIRAPHERYFRMFEEQGFRKRDDYCTFVLDISSTQLWESIGKKTRNAVRKAEKSGVEVSDAESRADLKDFYTLYLKTMKRIGSPPQPYKYFEKIWEYFYPELLKIRFADYMEKRVSGMMFFLYRDAVHYSYSCSLSEHLELRPNNLVLWSTIEWGAENNFKYFDFGRTRPNSGVYLFKKAWGGKQVAMPYFYRFYKRELKEREEVKYEKLSELWRKYIPERLAEKIGPWIIKQVG